MAIIAPEHGHEDSSSVKRKSNSTRSLKVSGGKKAKKAAGGAPEVMAKVTGFSKGASHAKANIDYISRNGDTQIENERGEVIEGRKEIKAFAKEWVADFGDGKRYKEQRDTMHLIMSMPEGTAPEAVRRATREFARQEFGKNHEYVFALHTDTNSPHTHITVKTLGHDGKRLNPRKDDLQRYRETFAREMEREGYMANATPRKTRGVVKKPVRQAIIHIDKRGASTIKAKQVKEAAQELTAESRNLPQPPKPWVDKINTSQERIRAAWLAAAERLAKHQKQGADNERYTGRSDERGRADGVRRRILRVLAERLRTSGGIAGIYQSGYSASGRPGATQSVTSLRNLSGVTMAQGQSKQPQMLLHPDALVHLENRNGRTAGDAVRRSRTGINGDGRSDEESEREGRSQAQGQGKRLNKQAQASRLSDVELAEMVKQFVEKMPAVETASDQLKRDLRSKFTRPVREQATQVKAPEQESAKEPTTKPDKDIDR